MKFSMNYKIRESIKEFFGTLYYLRYFVILIILLLLYHVCYLIFADPSFKRSGFLNNFVYYYLYFGTGFIYYSIVVIEMIRRIIFGD